MPENELKGKGPGHVSLLAGQRNFRPGVDLGRYGLIERDPHANKASIFPYCCGFSWTYSEPCKPVRTVGGEDAGAFIANMLYDTNWPRGRSAKLPTAPGVLSAGAPNNHFDVTIEELLTLTAKKTLRFKNKAHIEGHRGHSVLACFQTESGPIRLLPRTGKQFSRSDYGGEDVPPEFPSEPDFDDGMSVILIETGHEG